MQDFAAVVIINLAVSLFVALFFVPFMIDKIKLEKKKTKEAQAHLDEAFLRFILLASIRDLFITCAALGCRPVFLLVLGFGLPVFMFAR